MPVTAIAADPGAVEEALGRSGTGAERGLVRRVDDLAQRYGASADDGARGVQAAGQRVVEWRDSIDRTDERLRHPRSGLIMGSGGGSPENQIAAADVLRERGRHRPLRNARSGDDERDPESLVVERRLPARRGVPHPAVLEELLAVVRGEEDERA